jgi:cell pole-organizing protein PopZ
MNATNAPQNSSKLQAEQKAHEPSMEDILASIRRIIADDDALPLSRRAVSGNPPPAADAAAPPPDLTPLPFPSPSAPLSFAAPPVIPPLRAEPTGPTLKPPPSTLGNPFPPRIGPLPLPPVIASAAQAAVAPPALELRPSLDEAPAEAQDQAHWDDRSPSPAESVERAAPPVAQPGPHLRFDGSGLQAAQLAFRASFATPPVAVAEKEAAPPPAIKPQPAETRVADIKPPQIQTPTAQTPTVQSPAVQAPAVQAPPHVAAPEAPEPQAESLQVFSPQVFSPQVAAEAPRSVGLPPARLDRPEPSLLSETSDIKIGAAFEALAESALLRDPEMVERLTREILRPIIKSWLDDNLPNVVERLVRAEIERVARGPKR